TGLLVNHLKGEGMNAVGVDLWDYSEKHLIQIKDNKLPFKNNSFDIIYFMHSVAHIENIEKMIKECRRVIKSNGHIIIITTNPRFLMFYGITNRIRKHKIDYTVVKYHGIESLKSLFPKEVNRKAFAIYYYGRCPFCKEQNKIHLNIFKHSFRERLIYAVRICK
ncbi:MAG: class I SAM-dependent methyltransferase, partial [Proteobacteria bacterium]|nr:class I SAM-dependent methyltransferase [Pseudomonadota bacterium]